LQKSPVTAKQLQPSDHTKYESEARSHICWSNEKVERRKRQMTNPK
jgi:hypothetical protein